MSKQDKSTHSISKMKLLIHSQHTHPLSHTIHTIHNGSIDHYIQFTRGHFVYFRLNNNCVSLSPSPPPKGRGTILNLQLQHYNNSCFVNEYKLHNMSLFILRGQKMQRQKKQPKNLTKLKTVNPKIKHTTTSQMYYMYYN